MIINLAELRHRITIQRPTKIIDAEGNVVEDFRSDLQTIWAKVLPAVAKISDGYLEEVQEVTYKIAVRYGVDIQITDFLLWEGKTLKQIAPPYLADGKKKYLILEARELVEDG